MSNFYHSKFTNNDDSLFENLIMLSNIISLDRPEKRLNIARKVRNTKRLRNQNC